MCCLCKQNVKTAIDYIAATAIARTAVEAGSRWLVRLFPMHLTRKRRKDANYLVFEPSTYSHLDHGRRKRGRKAGAQAGQHTKQEYYETARRTKRVADSSIGALNARESLTGWAPLVGKRQRPSRIVELTVGKPFDLCPLPWPLLLRLVQDFHASAPSAEAMEVLRH